jgi:hypothetical protein
MKQNRNIKTFDIFKTGTNKSNRNGHLSFFQLLKDLKLANALENTPNSHKNQKRQYLSQI